MTELNSINNPSQEDTIDIKALLFQALSYWKIFVLAVGLSLSIAYFFNKYTDPIYEASSKVLIMVDNQNINPFNAASFFKQPVNIENEMAILRSFDLTQNAISKMDWQLSYFRYGQIRENQMFENQPFKVEIDTNHLQAVGLKFDVVMLSDKRFVLKVPAVNQMSLYHYGKNETSDQTASLPKGLDQEFSFGQKITTDLFSFTIQYKQMYGDDKEFYFYMNSLENLAMRYNGRFQVKPMHNDATIVLISIKDENSKQAIQLVNAITQAYVNYNLDFKNKQSESAIRFIDDQLAGITDSLKSSEKRLENYRENNQMLSISDVSSTSFERVYALDKEKAKAELQADYFRYLKNYIKKGLSDKEGMVAPSILDLNDPILIGLVGQLNELYMKRNELAASSTLQNPAAKQIELKIKNTERALVENIQNIEENSKIQLESIDHQLSVVKAEIQSLPQKERQLVDITRQYKVNENTYSFLLEKRVESGITRAGNVSDYSVIDIARRVSMVYPKTSLNYTIALLLGLLIPIGFIFVKEFFNDKIRSKKDIEAVVNVPIIGVVGHYEATGNTVVLDKPKSVLAETFRSIRTNFQFLSHDKELKVISVTSTFSGEGKTFNSINIASIFSISGKKTVLLGCDLRKPKIFEDFQLANDKGITTYLIGRAKLSDIIQQTAYDNIDIITAGPVPPNPSELLESKAMSDLIEELKLIYDIVIIDTPPIGLVTDAIFMMERSDVSAYIVRQDYTTKAALNALKEVKNLNKIRNLAVIVNDVQHESGSYSGYGYGGYGYSYGYGYGYGYGNYYQEEETPKKKKTLGQRLFKI
jgi:capsular exopolysaccharide synthesis family protein